MARFVLMTRVLFSPVKAPVVKVRYVEDAASLSQVEKSIVEPANVKAEALEFFVMLHVEPSPNLRFTVPVSLVVLPLNDV